MSMNTFIFSFIILYLQFYYVISEEQCLKNDNNCSDTEINENKYTKDLNTKYAKILKKIETAISNYEPCKSTNCSCYSGIISKDLKLFQSGITEEIIKSVRTKGTKYQIIDGQLYRDKDCLFPSRCEGIEYFLLKLAPKMPDMEFIINTRDWPQISKHMGKVAPVFSFSKTYDYADIMYPTWSFWEGGPAISLYPRGLGRWDTHRTSVSKAGDKYTWTNKMNKAFFRGSRTSSERDPLVLLSREHPNLVDAQYTKNQAWKSDADTLHAPPASEVSLEDHCKYKYLFNFRGVAASFRFKHLFLCKSLVFHVGHEWIEFFYPLLKPWVHYIPVDTHASKEDIKLLIEFARDNDDVVKKIAVRGYEAIWDHLKMEDVLCYWRILLKRYYKLLMYKPILDKKLIRINKK